MGRIKELWALSEILKALSNNEFEDLIFNAIKASPTFSNVNRTKATKDASYDFFADEKIGDNKFVKAAFQIKRTSLITPDYIRNIGDYWENKGYFKTTKLYIVTEGTVIDEASKRANKYGIRIWDIYKLAKLIGEIRPKENVEHATGQNKTKPKEETFSIELEKLRAGQDYWSNYQQLACNIFTHLFCPPLESPRFEHSDAEGRNRRDMIFENANEHSFWKSIKENYQADYIVVDAKNSGDLLDKRPVIDIAHYLKPYGCGMFGILLTRKGTSEAANHAIKEQWIGNKKMIVAFNDSELHEMLRIKQTNGRPEEIIRMKLADFRMSL